MRSRYFIPLILFSVPIMGLLLGSVLGDQLSIPSSLPPYWELSHVSDGYEAGGILGLRVSIAVAILISARRAYNEYQGAGYIDR